MQSLVRYCHRELRDQAQARRVMRRVAIMEQELNQMAMPVAAAVIAEVVVEEEEEEEV